MKKDTGKVRIKLNNQAWLGVNGEVSSISEALIFDDIRKAAVALKKARQLNFYPKARYSPLIQRTFSHGYES